MSVQLLWKSNWKLSSIIVESYYLKKKNQDWVVLETDADHEKFFTTAAIHTG